MFLNKKIKYMHKVHQAKIFKFQIQTQLNKNVPIKYILFTFRINIHMQ